MPIQIEEPITEKRDGPMGGTRTSHPAFAQIVGSRRQGGHNILYGSDFVHRNTICVTISTSELHRDLSNDWHFADKEIIEIEMSESQWATFVSALNIGSGVPCTIRHQNGQRTPRLPDPRERHEQHTAELNEYAQGMLKAAMDGLAMLDGMNLPKGKTAQLKSQFEMVIAKIKSGMPFVVKQFEEHMEETVEKAKTEVHGYMTNQITRAGLEALGSNMPLQLEDKSDE